MNRCVLLLLISLSPLFADTEKIQLQTIVITAADDINTIDIGCSTIKSIKFCSNGLSFNSSKQCFGSSSLRTTNEAFVLTVSADEKATLYLPKTITWELVFKSTAWNQTINGTLDAPNNSNHVFQTEEKVLALNEFLNVTYGNLTVTFTYMTIKTETTTENKNTQAVVVAVLEGLILGAILILFIYRQCFVKPKQQRAAATGGFSGPGTNVGNPTGGNNYYDNAAVAYRQNNTTRNESYGYDQSPIRLEDRSRSTEQTRPSEPTTDRVQTDSPSLVPVPLDPLTQWNDNRNGTAPDRLFS